MTYDQTVDTESNKNVEVNIGGRKGQLRAMRRGETMPPNAEIISSQYLARIRYNSLSNYPLNISWPLNFGTYGVFGVSVLSCTALTFVLRHRFNLAYSGIYYVRSYLAPAAACLSSAQLYNLAIIEPVLTGNTKCEVCYPLRASLLNLLTGFAMPSALALYTTIYSARSTGTYPNLPSFIEYNALYKEMRVATKGTGKIFYLCMLACAATPFFFAWKTQELIVKLHSGQLDKKSQSEFTSGDTDPLTRP